MPYDTLPKRLRDLIPSKDGQEMFRNVVNSQLAADKTEAVAMASAWAALERAGYGKSEDGTWVQKSSTEGLRNKLEMWNEKHAGKHGKITMGMLQDVYDRGVGAYRTNPSSVRPNVASPEQWAMARVNSFLEAARGSKKVNHDQDIHDKIKKTMPTASQVHVDGADWKRRKKPKVEKAEYQGRNVALDKPFRMPKGSSKKFGVYVKDGDRVKRVTFGDPNMEIRRDDAQARANFRSRHSCDTATDKTSARYWSCRMWTARTSVSELAKRYLNDDSFTTREEAAARSYDLGLEGEVHVHQTADGQAVYMPGEDHEDYLEAMARAGGLLEPEEYEEEDEYEDEEDESGTGLLERAISAILEAVTDMEKGRMTENVTKTADILKVDRERRIVWGWASVSTLDGELVTDLQGDTITPQEMEKMADRFMASARTAKAMHQGDQIGEVLHSFPITNEIAKAFGMETDREGWIIGMKIHDDAVWQGFKDGTYKAFSIGGRSKRERIA